MQISLADCCSAARKKHVAAIEGTGPIDWIGCDVAVANGNAVIAEIRNPDVARLVLAKACNGTRAGTIVWLREYEFAKRPEVEAALRRPLIEVKLGVEPPPDFAPPYAEAFGFSAPGGA